MSSNDTAGFMVTMLIFMVILNFGFMWFQGMGFFNVSPTGNTDVQIAGSSIFDAGNWAGTAVLTVIVMIVLGPISILASNTLKINGFGMFMFSVVIWAPFLNTINIFRNILASVPAEFSVGLISLFIGIMVILYLYVLAEWSKIGALT
jgi:hypothetical protein